MANVHPRQVYAKCATLNMTSNMPITPQVCLVHVPTLNAFPWHEAGSPALLAKQRIDTSICKVAAFAGKTHPGQLILYGDLACLLQHAS